MMRPSPFLVESLDPPISTEALCCRIAIITVNAQTEHNMSLLIELSLKLCLSFRCCSFSINNSACQHLLFCRSDYRFLRCSDPSMHHHLLLFCGEEIE